MKKLTLTILTASLGLICFGQIPTTVVSADDLELQGIGDVGQIFGDAGIHLYTNSSESSFDGEVSEGPKGMDFEICGSVGYMVAPTIATRVNLAYALESEEEPDFSEGTITTKTNMFNVGVGAVKFWPCGQSNRVVGTTELGVNLGFGGESYESESSNFESNLSEFSVALMPGATVFVNDNFSVNMGLGKLGYFSEKQTSDDSDAEYTDNSFKLKYDLKRPRFSLSYWFGRGHIIE